MPFLLGQLQAKHLHSTDSVNFLQDVNYAYNERGWLLNQNAGLFSEQLQYNDTGQVKGISPAAQYNGNIASQTWQSNNAANNSYLYTYDQLNRLTSGITADNQFAEQGIAYDMAGNINTFSRTFAGVNIDNLQYRYNGNQLQSIRDSSPDTSQMGYQGGNGSYTYDGNGNLSQVLTKQGTGSYTTSYNILNLPDTITTQHGTVTYTYDATGEKLNKTSTIDSVTTTTDYISGIQYTNGKIAFIQTEEGRALPDSGTFNYEYTLADHLGNSRLSFDSEKGYARVNQQDDYLPFGMEIAGEYKSPKNEYLYNKKELQEELGQYDYGARFYDPVVARFTTEDRYTEKFDALTPYQYGALNPINTVDINGDTIKILFKNQLITYQNGKLYGTDGKEYKGAGAKLNKDGTIKGYKGFLGDAKSALDKIGEGSSGNDLLSDLEGNKNTAYIRKVTGYNDDNENGTRGAVVSWDPNSTKSGKDESGSDERDSYIGLAHELAHSLGNLMGTSDYGVWFNLSNKKPVYNAEKDATFWENKIRAEHGLNLREYYGEDNGKDVGHILVPLPALNSGISTVNNISIGTSTIPYFYSKKDKK